MGKKSYSAPDNRRRLVISAHAFDRAKEFRISTKAINEIFWGSIQEKLPKDLRKNANRNYKDRQKNVKYYRNATYVMVAAETVHNRIGDDIYLLITIYDQRLDLKNYPLDTEGKEGYIKNMGKYNRPTKSNKLQKLTSRLEVSIGSEELQNQVAEIAEAKGMKLQKPTAKKVVKKTIKKVEKPKVMVTKKAVKIIEEIKAITPKPEAKPEPKVEAKPIVIDKSPKDLEAMNVYKKMQLVRSTLAKMELTQSCKNEEIGFTYFQLGDYLPQINILGEQVGLMTHFNMNTEKGLLKIVNIDKPEEVIEFELPAADLVMADEEGKPAEGIQVMKGKSTYMRRALFENAFEISVKDTVDNRGAKPEKKAEDLDPRDIAAIQEATELKQLATICQNIGNRKGFNKQAALLEKYTSQKGKLEK